MLAHARNMCPKATSAELEAMADYMCGMVYGILCSAGNLVHSRAAGYDQARGRAAA